MVQRNYDEEISTNLNDVEFRFGNPEHVLSEIFSDVSDIDPRSISVINDNDHDETQRTLNLLEKHGALVQQDYRPKIFCPARPEDNKIGFEVKSDRFVWNIVPINNDNIVQIPEIFIKKCGVLAANNIETKGFALGEPKPIEDRYEVIKQELISEAKVLSKISGIFLSLVAAALKSTVNSSAVAPGSVESPKLVELPDPVLLVMIDDNWIEIGRWE